MAATNGVSDIQKQIEKLKAEQERADQRIRRRRQQNARDENRKWKAKEQIRRLELIQLLGQPGAVQKAYRSSGKSAHLNDKRGTLIEVKRTRGLVKFEGEDLPWDFLLKDLQPAGQLQGMVMNLALPNLGLPPARNA